jgi:PIN domain nuclease of toxin-antitoxin system
VTSHPRAVLLDTCAVIWLPRGELGPAIIDLLAHAGSAEGVFVSPVSAWEIGLLANPRGTRTKSEFLPDPIRWFAQVMSQPMIRQASLTAEAAINASLLPPPLHNDPADRLLIATARERSLPIVTRDQKILDYAALGHVQAIAC